MASCQKDDNDTIFSDENFAKSTVNFVPENQIISIASKIRFPLEGGFNTANHSSSRIKTINKEIENILKVPDQTGEVALYIINYKDSGFIIISADNRINPVRAFSLKDKFPVDTETLPNGLIGWLSESSYMIGEIRTLDKDQTETILQTWDQSEIQASIMLIDPDDGNHCEDQSTYVGPYLTTEWGQWGGYNDFSPNLGCAYTQGKAPSGCVATAMAQVMKYHEYPYNYNWEAMPNNIGSTETSILMKDIGDAVGMTWGCDGSGASMSAATSGYANVFNYKSAHLASFNHETVK
ncbi:C10 family peptidase [Flammeovirga aprica]|uniref:C10 family peptidase n=1 Tax=Flammeovirga aprica TaxID=29528 RepID=UPI00197D01DA